MLPYTKPCRNCAKPIRKDAANCWFCGDVFDIVRCVECGHPIKIGSPACQICGEEAPEPPPPKAIPAASPGAPPPAAKRADEQDCPECGGSVPLAAIQCKHCGEQLDGPVRRTGLRSGDRRVDPHRGGSLIAAGILSFLFPLIAFVPLAFAVAFGGAPLWFWLVGFGFLGIGLLLSTSAVVFTFLDLKAMNLGRKNSDGWGRTLMGGALAGVSALLHWCVIGYCILHLL